MSSTTLYQRAILQDDDSQKRSASTTATVREEVFVHGYVYVCTPGGGDLLLQPAGGVVHPHPHPHAHTHVKYTSAHPFTPEFVQGRLKDGNNNNNNNNASRARALYDKRVRRRQLGLAERRSDGDGRAVRLEKRKAKGGKGDGGDGDGDVAKVRRGERMGRREAAEKGVWRLRSDEAR